MIKDKKVLAIIPARGGSKGLPRKNIKDLKGKPLIAWTIEEAKKSNYIDRLILSSEDDEIIAIAREWGCEIPFRRPVELAQDDTPGIEPVIHAIKSLEEKYDYVVLLQPTSPLRTVKDIDACIERCWLEKADSCVSVCKVSESPYWMYTLDKKQRLNPLLKTEGLYVRRQDLPVVFLLNGAVYVASVPFLLRSKSFIGENTLHYEMPKRRSIDIDKELDLFIAECYLKKC